MRIAIPVWECRVSPVFDSARRLVVVDVEDEEIVARWDVPLAETQPHLRAAKLNELGVAALVCGAVSDPLLEMISSHGIRVMSSVAGEAEEVLTAYIDGILPDPRFMMPGCTCPRQASDGSDGWEGSRTCSTSESLLRRGQAPREPRSAELACENRPRGHWQTAYDTNLARLEQVAQDMGLTLNPDRAWVQKVVEPMTVNFEKHGDYFCPCKQQNDPPVKGTDPVCPCPDIQDEIARAGHCLGRLFFTQEAAKEAAAGA